MQHLLGKVEDMERPDEGPREGHRMGSQSGALDIHLLQLYGLRLRRRKRVSIFLFASLIAAIFLHIPDLYMGR